MKHDKQPHILNTSSNLMGICLVLITALKVTKASIATFIDEVSITACLAFMASCILSYISMTRQDKQPDHFERWADYFFLTGIVALFIAIILFATGNF
jgi:uncharacterized membrane protein SirB2